MNRHFSKNGIHLSNKYMKKCSASLIIGKCKSKPHWGKFPGQPVVRTPCCHCRGLGQSLVGERRSHMPRGMAKKKKIPPHTHQRRRQWHPTPVLLPGKSYGWRSLVGCSLWGRTESDTTERLHFDFSLSCIGEGNGNPLQCSCLENPRDRGARWAAVYGVAQSLTRLKRLSSSSSTPIRMATVKKKTTTTGVGNNVKKKLEPTIGGNLK